MYLELQKAWHIYCKKGRISTLKNALKWRDMFTLKKWRQMEWIIHSELPNDVTYLLNQNKCCDIFTWQLAVKWRNSFTLKNAPK